MIFVRSCDFVGFCNFEGFDEWLRELLENRYELGVLILISCFRFVEFLVLLDF